MRKKKLLKRIGVLCAAVLLSASVVTIAVLASESMHSNEANTENEMGQYASEENNAKLEEFCAHMMSGDDLKEGEERVLGTSNGEEFGVEVTGVSESAETNTADASVTFTSEELTPEMEEFYTHMMSGDNLKEGEERVLGTWNGEDFCVKVTDVAESAPSTISSETTTSKEFTFYKKSVLGTKKNVLKVTSECTWVKGSKINNLHCKYTTYASNISCSWNDNYKKATDTLHTLGLDVTYAGKSGIILFGASLSWDKQTLTLDCSEDYDL